MVLRYECLIIKILLALLVFIFLIAAEITLFSCHIVMHIWIYYLISLFRFLVLATKETVIIFYENVKSFALSSHHNLINECVMMRLIGCSVITVALLQHVQILFTY